jgi:WD40 repeat protein/serine/threonine protein kinase
MSQSPQREEELFAAALALPVAERQRYLEQACGGDAELLRRVEALLRAHEKVGDFLEVPLAAGLADVAHAAGPKPPPEEVPGAKIGRYKLLQKIGEGGCGVVYMAEQEEPVRRRVALKVIRLGMDTKEVIARFEAERQALALMDHPNIARVFDAGATDTGRPYFVMELVRGVKITDYCDQQNLSTAERLNLFIQVCHAIQHAHQKGIIHRDIKPSNILVTLEDGEPVPKVIDFGIAKATQGRLTDQTLFTAFEQFIGTPAYMSPEQAQLSSVDVDTRSDIYSLGVLLYELLTGCTPFEAKELLKAGLDEIRRQIREVEPSKPSTRLRTLEAEALTITAQHRQTEPPKLIHLVHGDLDWIVMRCLEKKRARRYETANELARDLERHLHDEPVTARPPSEFYRFQKLVRRNKLVVTAAAAIAAALVIGLAVSSWMYSREKAARERAVAAEKQQSRLHRQAEAERGRAVASEAQQRQLRQQAEDLRATAEGQARQIERQLYASHMNVAFQAWEKGDITRVEQLLDEHGPKPGEEDLRGFEWFYLRRLCHSDQLTLANHHALMRCVTFSPDGRLLATAGDDSTARIWDASTGGQLHVLSGHSDGVNSVAFAPDGKTLATGGGDQTVRLWNVATGESSAILHGHHDGVTALAFSPDGKWLASATGGLENGADKMADSKFVDIGELPAEIIMWDVEARKVITTLTGHTKSILSLVFSPDGKSLATGSADGTVKLWDVVSGKMETNLTGFSGPVMAVAISPDGQTLASGGGDFWWKQSELKLWDLVSHKERMVFKGHYGPVFTLAFSPDGRTLASAGMDRIVRLWNVATGEEVRTIKGHKASIWSLAYDPKGERIATASWDQTVKVWDAAQPQGPVVLPGVANLSSCFSPDGKFLILGGRRLQIFAIGAGQAPVTIPDYETGDLSLAISPDGSILASAGIDGIVTLWEVGTWRRLATLKGHTGDYFYGSSPIIVGGGRASRSETR